ncbi:lectin subunit alpha-like [Stomoxys calcitrans]|uniref:lectin subunit alpha-like n=1 Tax=Stomoxys calcitrans TaxID=35570 RepID=UPI0027E29F89|nr:lectin subunit alpha-like [Stomoxys calcitrans]
MQIMNASVVLLLTTMGFMFNMSFGAMWHEAGDGRRYLVEGTAKYNWLQALDQCLLKGLQLVVIDSAAKNEELVKLLRSIFGNSRDLWIGHHDEFNKKGGASRNWYSAAIGEPIFFGYWDRGEPNNRFGEHCAQIYRKSNFRWNDENCDTHFFGYICEKANKTDLDQPDIQ